MPKPTHKPQLQKTHHAFFKPKDEQGIFVQQNTTVSVNVQNEDGCVKGCFDFLKACFRKSQ